MGDVNLPEDVFTEILLRLPVKSLFKFRCVCKAWCSLIKSPRFINMHLSRPRDKYIMLMRFIRDAGKVVLSLHSHDESLRDGVVPNLEVQPFEFAQLIGPCNGITCITDYHDIYLCNPATHELKKLPPVPFGWPEKYIYTTDRVGFGFDPSTNDYKVIRVVCWLPERYSPYPPRHAEVYSLNANCWREIDVVLPFDFYFQACCALLFRGSFHWQAISEYEYVYECILSFDMSTEVFGVIQYPPGCIGSDGMVENKRSSLFNLDNSLALVLYTDPLATSPGEPEFFIDIWVMMEYGVQESWMKKFSIGPFSIGICSPICTWNDDKLLLASDSGQLISCSLLHKAELKEYDIYSSPTSPGGPTPLGALIYVETLVTLEGRSHH